MIFLAVKVGQNNTDQTRHRLAGVFAKICFLRESVFALQMHIVHYASKYASMGKALNMEDGIAVLAFLFKVSFIPYPLINFKL